MKSKNKYLITPQDRLDDPIPEMGEITRQIIVDARTSGSEVLTFAYAKIEPTASGKAIEKKHQHPNAELVAYITSGKGMVEVEDERFEVKPGDSIWVPKGHAHWFNNPFDEPWEIIFVYSCPSLKEAGLVVVE
jgi:mannose-6-phosphate isomerase-like protein (cupin superfamily)